jgi:tetratricopeptide (TPR) repeat protein
MIGTIFGSLISLTLQHSPIVLDEIDITSEIRKPSVFFIASPPAELRLNVAPDSLTVFLARARIMAHIAGVDDLLVVARDLAARAREATGRKLAACDSTCDAAADLRPALAIARQALARVDGRRPQTHALIWSLASDSGPAMDTTSSLEALASLSALAPSPEVLAWAHFTLGAALRDEGRLPEAREHLQRASDVSATLADGGTWHADYLLAFVEARLGSPQAAERLKRVLERLRGAGSEMMAAVQGDLVALWATSPDGPAEVEQQLAYLEAHAGNEARVLAETLRDHYEFLGEVAAMRAVERWLAAH